MNAQIPLEILFSVLVIVSIAYILFVIGYLLTFIENKRYLKAILCSLQNIVNMYGDANDYEICIEQIDIMFADIINKNSYTKRKFPNVSDLLVFYVSAINCEYRGLKEIDDRASKVRKALEIKKQYENKNPLDQIKGANNILLNQLMDYFKNDNQEKFDETINQLAVELKDLEDGLLEKEKNSKKQDAMTKMGIILSFVFGVMTFIQFFV